MEIIQIVPRLPPAINGVGDYAYLLAKQLRTAHDIHTIFVVCDPTWESPDGRQRTEDRGRAPAIRLDGFPVFQLKERSAEDLLRIISASDMPATVLLQYVGYGYEKRGCPVWLVRGLEKWSNSKVENGKQTGISEFQLSAFSFSAKRRLVTMFHELYAFGPPWRSSFWSSLLQRWIVKSLARLSGHCFTNRAASAKWLVSASHHPMNAIPVLPVFSNVGEVERLPDWNERLPRMIVFGSASQRRKVYFECKTDLENACGALGLNEIVDIGAPLEIPSVSVRISRRGILTAQEINREMLTAAAGFFAYPTPFLGKSGVFAAYAAHGLAPVTFPANLDENEDGLRAGEHYLLANELSGCAADEIGTRAHRWYQKHGTTMQASCYASRLEL